MSGEFYFHNYDADLKIYSGGLLSQVNSHRHNPQAWCGIATVRLQHMRWCENTNSSDVQIQIPRTSKITIRQLEILSFWFIAYCASFTCLRFPKEKTAANNCMLTTIQFLWRVVFIRYRTNLPHGGFGWFIINERSVWLEPTLYHSSFWPISFRR